MPRVSDEHLEARRRQILEAAIRCFAREGFHQTSMQDILAESGLSTGAIYRYFESKDDLIGAIAEEVLRTAERVWDDGDPRASEAAGSTSLEDDVLDRLFAVLEGFSLGDEGERVRLALQLWSEALSNPRVRSLLRGSIDRFRAEISARVRAGQDAGEIDSALDPEAVGRAIGSLFQGFVLQRALWEDLDTAGYRRAAKALLRGLAAAPSR